MGPGGTRSTTYMYSYKGVWTLGGVPVYMYLKSDSVVSGHNDVNDKCLHVIIQPQASRASGLGRRPTPHRFYSASIRITANNR